MTNTPDIGVPPNTTYVGDWQPGERPPYRFICGTRRVVNVLRRGRPDAEVTVGTTAVQLGDGSLDDGDKIECPKVWIGLGPDDSLTTGEARQVARALMSAADELDGWVQEAPR